jgi:hypothetical protein
LGFNGLVQRERARDVDFKRTGFDKAIEFFERRRAVFAVEALDFDAGSLLGDWLHSIRIGGAPPSRSVDKAFSAAAPPVVKRTASKPF